MQDMRAGVGLKVIVGGYKLFGGTPGVEHLHGAVGEPCDDLVTARVQRGQQRGRRGGHLGYLELLAHVPDVDESTIAAHV